MCLLFLLLAIILSFWLYFWGVMCSDCGTAKPVYLARERLLNRLEWCLNFVNICIYFIQLEKKKKWRKRKRNFCRVTHEHELPWSTRKFILSLLRLILLVTDKQFSLFICVGLEAIHKRLHWRCQVVHAVVGLSQKLFHLIRYQIVK